VCHSTKTFRAPLRLSGYGDIEWTHYPLEPARRLSEKACKVLRNVGINEPDFDQYLQEHVEYQTWSPKNDHSDWKPEYRMLGPPSGLASSAPSVQAADWQPGLQFPESISRERQSQGIAPAESVMNPSSMHQLPYLSHLDRNLKRSLSEHTLCISDTIVDREIEGWLEKEMRVPKPSQTTQTPQAGTSNEMAGQVAADQSMTHFVHHIPMDQDYAASKFGLFAGEGLTQIEFRPLVHR
jgi:hypothetical protein